MSQAIIDYARKVFLAADSSKFVRNAMNRLGSLEPILSSGSFVRVDIKAVTPPHPSWTVPVRAFFTRTGSGWSLVGFERLPEDARR